MNAAYDVVFAQLVNYDLEFTLSQRHALLLDFTHIQPYEMALSPKIYKLGDLAYFL